MLNDDGCLRGSFWSKEATSPAPMDSGPLGRSLPSQPQKARRKQGSSACSQNLLGHFPLPGWSWRGGLVSSRVLSLSQRVACIQSTLTLTRVISFCSE